MLEVGLSVWQRSVDSSLDAVRLATRAREAEIAGFDSLWVTDPGLGYTGSLAATPLLAVVAAATEYVHLGSAVLILPLYSPVRLAQEMATIDQVSGGRLVVGVGLGGKLDEYLPYGVESSARVRRFEAALATVIASWTENRVQAEGPDWRVDGLQVFPKPVQRPHPPLWFGASSEISVARAVRWGTGWIGAGAVSTEEHLWLLDRVFKHLTAAGRRREEFVTAKRVYVAVGENRVALMKRMRAALGEIYGMPEMAERVALVGNVDYCVEHLARIRDAGTDTVILHPLFDYEAQVGALTLAMRELKQNTSGQR